MKMISHSWHTDVMIVLQQGLNALSSNVTAFFRPPTFFRYCVARALIAGRTFISPKRKTPVRLRKDIMPLSGGFFSGDSLTRSTIN